MLLLMVTIPYIFSRKIVFGIQKPNKSKLGKIYLLFVFLFLAFGSVMYTNSVYYDGQNAMGASILGISLSLLILFITPVMLIKPKEVKEITKRDY
ncbi:hypothetical protein [Gracilibacillus salinarum]|uniref:Uncharacterized protein n=1 Tax=Gracilibacillus salinarum TaxID=2932255 RepID=A0ABY4GHA9_9BACI|nr:hypothetical protein [Gracilibacillus salinarum]UOQ83629.1 hypothetical protein MUN87_12775 [Gracilibacillus salinarum]